MFEQGKGVDGGAGGLQFIFFEEKRKIRTNRGLGALRKSVADAFFSSSDGDAFVCVCVCRTIKTILPTLPVATLDPLVNLNSL